MIRKTILFNLLLLNAFHGFGCTTFILETANQLVFGRNLDWFSENGIIAINQRKVQKTSIVFPPDKPIEWTSKYGSLTFNQFGREFPFGGINEKGLVIEIMISSAQYEAYDNRKAISELQWVQYQLDNSRTIDEVINSRAFLRISPIEQDLHFLICDSSGNSAVIEFQNESMVVYRGDSLPIRVLENDPYHTSLSNVKGNFKCRFGTAAHMIEKYSPETDTSIINYSFKILDRVAMSAEWSIVYDIRNMSVYFKTSSNKAIKEIDMKQFDFDCTTDPLFYDLMTENAGNINTYFSRFSPKVNLEKLKFAVESNNVIMPKRLLRKFYNYHKECRCLE